MDRHVGFIGLGGMGIGMASLLARYVESFEGKMFVFNRTNTKTKAFCTEHREVLPADGPSELASRCRFTFSCLANDDALLSVFHQYLENLPLNKSPNETEKRIYVDMSTVKPETTRHLAALAVEHGVTFIHCPVFGRPDAAAAGKLKAVISGGNKSERDLVAEMIESSFAQKGVMDLGDDPGSASAMKLVGNFYILGQIELAAECLTVAAKAGLPAMQTLDLMQYISSGPIPGGYARRIAAGDFNANGGFSIDLGLKDVSHIQDLGRELTVPIPVADLARQHLLTAKAQHGGHLDWSAIGLAVQSAAGLEDGPYLMESNEHKAG